MEIINIILFDTLKIKQKFKNFCSQIFKIISVLNLANNKYI